MFYQASRFILGTCDRYKPTVLFIFLPYIVGCNFDLKSHESSSTDPSHFGGAKNVVWLVCEDQSLWMPPYGDSTASMPHLSSLSADGTVFENMFSNAPVCAPSRSSIITGELPPLIGSHHMRSYLGEDISLNVHTGLPSYSIPAPAGVKMFTEQLRASGVCCLNNSKEDYNFKPTPLAWDESSPSAHWDLLPQEIKFFSVFNYFGTHESRIWNTVEAPCQADFLDVPIPKLLPEHPEVRKDVHQNYCNLERLDDWVGHHVGRLKEEGIYDQTMIVFFSDHGGPFPRYKRDLSDAGLHVPFIVKWPKGVSHPKRNSGLFSFIDLSVTILHWLGVSKNTSFSQQVILPFGEGHMAVFGASDRMDEQEGRRRSVRTAKWRLTHNSSFARSGVVGYASEMRTTKVLNSSNSTKKLTEIELYDMSRNQLVPLGAQEHSRYKNVIDSLKQLLNAVFNPLTDLGRIEEREMFTSVMESVEAYTLAAPDIIFRGDSMQLTHSDSSVSLGWRLDDEVKWRVTTSRSWMDIPNGRDSVHAIASRIGYESGSRSMKLGR